MVQIPKISKALQKKHEGQSVAIVDGKMVAFGKDSVQAEKLAIAKGYKREKVMTTYIMGTRAYAL